MTLNRQYLVFPLQRLNAETLVLFDFQGWEEEDEAMRLYCFLSSLRNVFGLMPVSRLKNLPKYEASLKLR